MRKPKTHTKLIALLLVLVMLLGALPMTALAEKVPEYSPATTHPPAEPEPDNTTYKESTPDYNIDDNSSVDTTPGYSINDDSSADTTPDYNSDDDSSTDTAPTPEYGTEYDPSPDADKDADCGQTYTDYRGVADKEDEEKITPGTDAPDQSDTPENPSDMPQDQSDIPEEYKYEDSGDEDAEKTTAFAIAPAALLAAAFDTVTVTVTHSSPGDILSEVSVAVYPGDTAQDALTRVLSDHSIPIVADPGFVHSIAGIANDPITWEGWRFSVNGIIPQVGLNHVFVNAGDVLRVQFLAWGDSGELGTEGSINQDIEGFAFSIGQLTSETITDEWGWDTTFLTLTLPEGTASVRVTAVPEDGEVQIFRSADGFTFSDTAFTLNQDIPLAGFSSLRVVIGSYEHVYDIGLSFVGRADIDTIMENIAAAMTGSSQEWDIIAMSAYRLLNPGTANTTSAIARQSYINYAITVISDFTQSLSGQWASPDAEYAKAIIALQSLGIDAGQVFPANSMTALNAFTNLQNVAPEDMASLMFASTATVVLNSFLQQPQRDFSAQQNKILEFLLSEQAPSGAWGFDFEGFQEDVDTTASVITGLASFYRAGNPNVVSAVDRALTWLSGRQSPSGAFMGNYSFSPAPNANSTATVVIALASLGLDPDSNSIFQYSALEGLLTFVAPNYNGFTADGTLNTFATRDGFFALIAAGQFYRTGSAFNVYDFSSITNLQPGRATGAGAVTPPRPPVSPTNISVAFTLRGLGGQVWMSRRTVNVPSDATMHHLFTTQLSQAGFTFEGADAGYIRSITHPSIGTLSEFQHGPNSGWVFSVNGVLPTIGMTDVTLQDGDNVIWYFTSDFTREPGAGSFTGRPAARPEEDDEDEDDEEEDEYEDGDDPDSEDDETQRRTYSLLIPITYDPNWQNPHYDVSADDWFYDAVRFVSALGLMTGTENGFEPNANLSRAMLITILARAVSVDTGNGETWYSAAVAWAIEAGISDGANLTGDITREQLVTMLFRFAQLIGRDTSNRIEITQFDDADNVSDWARSAMEWAIAEGIVQGRTDAEIEPTGNATRAETAAILMRFLLDAQD